MNNNMSLTVYDGHSTSLSLVYETEKGFRCHRNHKNTGLKDRPDPGRYDIRASEGMISEDDDITFLAMVREYYPEIVRTFLSGQGSFKNTMESINYPEIFSYLTRLWNSREMNGKISKAFGPYSLSLEDCTIRRMSPEQTEELSLINSNLKKMANTSSIQLQEFVRDGIIMLATFAEAREDCTGGHIFRIRELTREICEGMGLSLDETEDISFSSMMHDVGKVRISEAILLKPGPLDDEERMVMQGHCEAGERMFGDKPVYGTAREISRSHHERWDGTGYPDGLRGGAIPLAARITAIADAFDTITHERSYKKTWPSGMAVREMRALTGRQFDPDIMEVFLRIQSGEINKAHMASDILEY